MGRLRRGPTLRRSVMRGWRACDLTSAGFHRHLLRGRRTGRRPRRTDREAPKPWGSSLRTDDSGSQVPVLHPPSRRQLLVRQFLRAGAVALLALFRRACGRVPQVAPRKPIAVQSTRIPWGGREGQAPHWHRPRSSVFSQSPYGFGGGLVRRDRGPAADAFQYLSSAGTTGQRRNLLPQHLGKGLAFTCGPLDQPSMNIVRHITNLNHLAHTSRVACETHAQIRLQARGDAGDAFVHVLRGD